MNEEQMHRLMMLAAMATAVICGLACVGVLVMSAMNFSFGLILVSLLLGGAAVACGWTTTYFGARVDPVVFNNAAEREVLSMKQRRALRKARGEVVMDKAMVDIEHERANVVHNLQLEAADTTKPPYQTQFSPETDWTKRLPTPTPRPLRCEHNRKKGECFEQDCDFY